MSPAAPLRAQRLLWLGLLAVVALSAFLLWTVRSGSERRLRGEPQRTPTQGPDELLPPLEIAVSAGPTEPELGARTELAGAALDEALGTPASHFDPRTLHGRVLCRGAALEGVEVRLFDGTLERRELVQPLAETQSAKDGTFRLPEQSPHHRYRLHFQHPDTLPDDATAFAGIFEEYELEPAARIAGTVLQASTRQPIAGIEVLLERAHATPEGLRDWVRTTSDAAGRWALPWAEPGMETLTVLRPGSLAERFEFQVPAEGGEGYEILLQEARGVELELYLLEDGSLLTETEVWTDEGRLRSDARGRLWMPFPATSDAPLRVSLWLEDGCRTERRVLLETLPTPFLRVPLTRGASASGRVVDADGNGVEGALVRHSGGSGAPRASGIPEGFWLSSTRVSTRTAADGSFRRTGLPPREGLVELRAEHPEHPSGRSGPFELARVGAEVEVVIRLEAAARVHGLVTLDGEPAALRVFWFSERGSGWTRANDRGEYALSGLPNGSVNLRVRQEGEDEDEARAGDQDVLLEPLDAMRVDFALVTDRLPITGLVLDADGSPVAGADVEALPREQEEWAGDTPRTESRSDGSFELLVPGEAGLAFDLSARSGARAVQVEDVRAGRTGVVLTLPALASLRLRVLDLEQREPVVGFQLYWRASETGSFERLVQGGRRFAPGPDGSFLAELPAGRLDLAISARAQGWIPVVHLGLELDAGRTRELQVELPRGIELTLELEHPSAANEPWRQVQRGRVVLATAEQWAERGRGGAFFQQEIRNPQTLRPDANGVVHLDGLVSGAYRFHGLPQGWSFRPRLVEVPPVAQHRARVTLEAEETAKPGEGPR